MFSLRPVPLSAHSLSSSLKPLSRTIALVCALTCASPAHMSLNCGLSAQFSSACPRPVRCHFCKGEGHIASACSTPTSNLVQRWCAILHINNRSQMDTTASTVVEQAIPPRCAPHPSSAVHAVARAHCECACPVLVRPSSFTSFLCWMCAPTGTFPGV
ncbi:hypothetical protein C8R44DRAFT_887815 [Mycena epipterygia]|nr:hypothetical protein C8R44DRAFT_887815 [Mycena epipterygia]